MTPPAGNYDGVVREIPYEEAQAALDAELELIAGIARDLLREKYEEKGDGWQYEEARYHMWKGIDEQFSATHYVDEGDLDRFEKHVGHGLNHILMASFVSDGAEDLTQRKASVDYDEEAKAVVEDHPNAVENFAGGALLNFLVGRLLDRTGGRARPRVARKALERELQEDEE